MITIRPFKPEDFEMICSWWTACGGVLPRAGAMIEDGTFVLELNKEPVMTLTVFLTQSKEVSYLEGFVAKPGLDKPLRHELGRYLWDHCTAFAKNRGYRVSVIYALNDRLASRYEALGMHKSTSGLTALAREL